MPAMVPTLLLLAELCWLAVLGLVATALFDLEPESALAAGGAVAGYFACRLTGALRLSGLVRSAVLGAVPTLATAGLVGALLSADVAAGLRVSLGGLAVAVLLGGFAWTRGWVLAVRPPGLTAVAVAFQTGLAAAAGALVLAALLDRVPAGTALPLAATGFLACGLGALLGARAHAAGRASAPGTFMLILTVALAVALALGFDRDVLMLLMAPLVWLWNVLAGLLAWLIGLMPVPEALEPEAMPGATAPSIDQPVTWRGGLPEWVRTAGQVAWYGGWALLLLHIVYVNLRDLLRRLGAGGHARADEGIRLAGGLRAELRALLHWAWLMVRRGLGALMRPEPSGARRLYRRLLALGVRRGMARGASETPGEYACRLSARFPNDATAVAAITEAYLPARYGFAAPSSEHLASAHAALRRLRMRHRRSASLGDNAP